MRNPSLFVRAALLGLAALALLPLAAHAQSGVVRWEDYRGDSRTGLPANPTVPWYPNNTPGTNPLSALRNISANPANAVRVGTSASIVYPIASATLCDTDNYPTAPSCSFYAAGRVMYAMLSVDLEGEYQLWVTHDDQVDVDLSANYNIQANPAGYYRTTTYGIPVGNVGAYSPNEDLAVAELLGTFSSVGEKKCALMRVYWNNAGGANHLRLYWARKATGDSGFGPRSLVPSSALFDVTNPASPGAAGCKGSITGGGNTLTVNKIIGTTGRRDASDVFTVSIRDNNTGATSYASDTTPTGNGTGQQASTGPTQVVTNTAYRVYDVGPSALWNVFSALYTPQIACTRNGTPYTLPSPTPAEPNYYTRYWTIPATAFTGTDAVSCDVTNTVGTPTVATLKVVKVSQGDVGSFSFNPTGSASPNGVAAHSITTAASEADAAGLAYTLTNAGAQTRVTEAAPTGFQLKSINCTGLGAGGTQTRTINANGAGGYVDLNGAATAAGSNIVCTFTNATLPKITLLKDSIVNGRAAADDQFEVQIRTGGAVGPVVSNTANSKTGGTGSTVTPGTGTTGTYAATAGTTYTLMEAPLNGANPAYYDTTISCANVYKGSTTVLPTGAGTSLTVTPQLGDNITCKFTNTRRSQSLQLVKSWMGAPPAGHTATVATTGAANNASVTSTASSTPTTGTAVTVYAGETLSLPPETFGGGATAAMYDTTVACTGGSTRAAAAMPASAPYPALTVSADTAPTTCTYTNTHKRTLSVTKAWANAIAGDNVSLTVTPAASVSSAVAGSATAPSTATAATARVTSGQSVSFAEAFTGAALAGNYSTQLKCVKTSDGSTEVASSLSGLSGTVTAMPNDSDVTCTYTNTSKVADLSVSKTNSATQVTAGTSTTYTVVVTNNGPAVVTGAKVTDTPVSGITCPAANTVTCTGTGCPAGPITMANLTSGLTLGTLQPAAPNNQVSLTFSCQVN